jgi:dihydrodipicolinate reductase
MQCMIRMLAFHDNNMPRYRMVDVPHQILPNKEYPEVEEVIRLLETIFYFGQNDVQKRPDCCSVSVGDVIFLVDNCKSADESKFGYVVCSTGFKKITKEEIEELEKSDRRERQFSHILDPCRKIL